MLGTKILISFSPQAAGEAWVGSALWFLDDTFWKLHFFTPICPEAKEVRELGRSSFASNVLGIHAFRVILSYESKQYWYFLQFRSLFAHLNLLKCLSFLLLISPGSTYSFNACLILVNHQTGTKLLCSRHHARLLHEASLDHGGWPWAHSVSFPPFFF